MIMLHGAVQACVGLLLGVGGVVGLQLHRMETETPTSPGGAVGVPVTVQSPTTSPAGSVGVPMIAQSPTSPAPVIATTSPVGSAFVPVGSASVPAAMRTAVLPRPDIGAE